MHCQDYHLYLLLVLQLPFHKMPISSKSTKFRLAVSLQTLREKPYIPVPVIKRLQSCFASAWCHICQLAGYTEGSEFSTSSIVATNCIFVSPTPCALQGKTGHAFTPVTPEAHAAADAVAAELMAEDLPQRRLFHQCYSIGRASVTIVLFLQLELSASQS